MKLQPLAQQLINASARTRGFPSPPPSSCSVLVMALSFRSGSVTKEASYFEVQRGDFLISVVEGGTVEAVNEVIVRSEVEGIARIIFIVAEGSYVKKGDCWWNWIRHRPSTPSTSSRSTWKRRSSS
jgi:hypothetical protein